MELPDLLSLVDDRRSLLEQPGEAHPVWGASAAAAGGGSNCMSCIRSEELAGGDHSAGGEPEQLADEFLLRCDEDLDWPMSPGGYDVHSAEDNCSIQNNNNNTSNSSNEEEDGEEVGDPMNNNNSNMKPNEDSQEQQSKNIEITSSEAKSNEASTTPKEELQKKENSLYSLRRNPKRSRRFIDQEYALDILPTSAGNSSTPISVTAAVIPVNVSAVIPVQASSKKNISSNNNSSIFNEKARACTECGKEFSSWKALFGHMRCHPEREWRGIQRPDNISEYKFSKSSGGVRRSSKKQRHTSNPAFMLDDDQDEELEALYIKVVPSDNESDTESIEAAYINGSCNASGGFNSSRGKIITGKRSKRSRQVSSSKAPSVQEIVAVTAAAATSPSTPAEIREERDMARCLVMLACAGKKASSSLGFEEDEDGDGGENHEQQEQEQEQDQEQQQGEDEGTSTTNLDEVPELKNNNSSKGSDEDAGNSGSSSSEMENHHLEDDEVMIVGDFEPEEHHHKPEMNPVGGGAPPAAVAQKECPVIDESGLLCTELLDPEFDGIRMKYECSTCKRIFKSHQALGGHRASHKKVKGCFAKTNLSTGEGVLVPQQLLQANQQQESAEEDITDEEYLRSDEQLIPLDFPEHHHHHHHHHHHLHHLPLLQSSAATATTLLTDSAGMTTSFRFKDEFGESGTNFGSRKMSIKGHECSICHRVFTSGQALGGHKRCHWGGSERPLSEPLGLTSGSSAPSGSTTVNLKPQSQSQLQPQNSTTHFVTQMILGSHGSGDLAGLLSSSKLGSPITALVEEECDEGENECHMKQVRGSNSISAAALEVIHKLPQLLPSSLSWKWLWEF